MIGLGSDKNNHEEVRILTRAGWFDWLEKQPNHHGWWTPRTSGIVGSISEMIHFASQCCSDKLPSQLALVCLTTTFEINLRPLSAAQLCHESNLRCSDTLPWCFVLHTFFLSSSYNFFVFSFFCTKSYDFIEGCWNLHNFVYICLFCQCIGNPFVLVLIESLQINQMLLATLQWEAGQFEIFG